MRLKLREVVSLYRSTLACPLSAHHSIVKSRYISCVQTYCALVVACPN